MGVLCLGSFKTVRLWYPTDKHSGRIRFFQPLIRFFDPVPKKQVFVSKVEQLEGLGIKAFGVSAFIYIGLRDEAFQGSGLT